MAGERVDLTLDDDGQSNNRSDVSCWASIASRETALSVLRLFALCRLIFTIIFTGFVLLHKSHPIDPGLIKSQGCTLSAQINHVLEFNFFLAIIAINALIMTFLWAGSVANKESCLLVYPMLEIPFIGWFFVLIGKASENLTFQLSLFFAFIFCILFIPFVVFQATLHLANKGRTMNKRNDIPLV